MLYLSVSALKDYLTCPKIYWYRVHKKQTFIPDRYIFRGNVVHEAIEKSSNEEDAIIIVNKLYRDNNKYTDSRVQDELESVKMIHNYYTLIEPHLEKRNINNVEKMFKIPWKQNVYLVGKIDRIDSISHKIYDWKTAMTIPDAYELQDMQFYVYCWAYEMLNQKKPEIYYGHLYSGRLFPIDIHNDMWYNIRQLIDKTIIQLTTDEFYPRLFGYKCKRCFYKGVCWSDYELGN